MEKPKLTTPPPRGLFKEFNMKSRSAIALEKRQAKAKECFKSAQYTIGDIYKGMSLFGITRGQFSMIDVILQIANQAKGKINLSLWTWCIADYEIKCIEALRDNGKIDKALLVIDSMARKKNHAFLMSWIAKFGPESVRFVVNHSKIATMEFDDMKFLIRGSMNLNNNPRFEQFDIDEGHEGFNLVKQIESELPFLEYNHDHVEARKASQIESAWSQCDLQPFFKQGKVWAK